MTRKTFFHILVRSSILAAMGCMTAVFITRGKLDCPGDAETGSLCGSCGKVNSCRLPGAKKYRIYDKEPVV